MRKAIYGLSGDPITNGHLWVIRTAARLFDHLTVAIANNPDKKYTFSLQERTDMARQIIESDRLTYGYKYKPAEIQVDVIENEYLAVFAQNRDIDWLVRGVRNEKDFFYEREMSHVNANLAPMTQTVFLSPPKELDGISSSFIKNMIGPDNWAFYIQDYVPPVTYQALLKKFSK